MLQVPLIWHYVLTFLLCPSSREIVNKAKSNSRPYGGDELLNAAYWRSPCSTLKDEFVGSDPLFPPCHPSVPPGVPKWGKYPYIVSISNGRSWKYPYIVSISNGRTWKYPYIVSISNGRSWKYQYIASISNGRGKTTTTTNLISSYPVGKISFSCEKFVVGKHPHLFREKNITVLYLFTETCDGVLRAQKSRSSVWNESRAIIFLKKILVRIPLCRLWNSIFNFCLISSLNFISSTLSSTPQWSTTNAEIKIPLVGTQSCQRFSF